MSASVAQSQPHLPRFSGGVLAGGEGRRFGGRDKGWLECAGQSFVSIVLDHLRSEAAEIRISANRHLDRYATLGFPVLTDRLGGGPLAGLLRLLETATTPWLLSLPCDALSLPADLPARLFAVQRANAADIVVLADEERDHPIIALTRTVLAADLEHFLLARQRHSVRDWQAGHRRALCRVQGPVINVNDATALQRHEQLLRSPAHG